VWPERFERLHPGCTSVTALQKGDRFPTDFDESYSLKQTGEPLIEFYIDATCVFVKRLEEKFVQTVELSDSWVGLTRSGQSSFTPLLHD